MSRGRKPKSNSNALNWTQLYDNSAGAYFQIIIYELGQLKNTGIESGFELLKKIKEEKSIFCKSKDTFPSIKPEEIPYKIPDNWVWCRLGEITDYGTSLKAEPKDLKNETWVLDLEDIEKTSSRLLCKIRFEERSSLSTKSRFKAGDVLYSKLRPYLDKVIVADEDGVCTTEILPLSCYGGINPYYFRYALKRLDFINHVNSLTKGMKMPRLGTKDGQLALIPLPPVSEQNNIIYFLSDFENRSFKPDFVYFNNAIEKKIINLHNSQLKASKLSIELNFQLTQLENLNQAILQEAVQGKLVAQDASDEPANKLLKRIKTEKSKSGKKEKPLPPIKAKEIPFEIPKSWVWCRLGEICSKIGSGSTPKGSNYSKKGFPFFRSQNIHNDGLVYDDIKFVSDEVQKQMNGTVVYPNDILLNITGGSLGRCALVPPQFIEGNVSQHVCIIRPLLVNTNFFHKLIMSPYFQKFVFSSTTGAGREGLPKYNLERFPIPLPSFSEQKRIVAEIERQLEKTKRLKEHIIANQQATEQLLKALLHGAFEVKEKKDEIKEVPVIEFKPRICNLAERTALASYLIKQFNSKGFGRVMLMKLLYLIEHVCKLDFNSHYKIKVAGPYDDYLIKEIELTLNKYQLYHSIQDKCDKKQVHYLPLGGVNNIDELFDENFSTETTEINQFVSKFRSSTWDHCEIIATLYAVWNNRIIRNEVITDDFLKQDFLDWDPNKEKYRDRLNESLVWMRRKEIVPDGWGKLVERPES